MYVCIHVFIYVYIYIYVYIHMYVICVYNNIVHFLDPPPVCKHMSSSNTMQTNCFILTAGEPYLACICFLYQPKVLKILFHWSHTNDRLSFIISSQVLCPCTLVSSLSDRAINPVGIINGMEIVPVGLYVKPGRDNTQNTPAKTCINPVGTRPNYWVHTCCLHRKKL